MSRSRRSSGEEAEYVLMPVRSHANSEYGPRSRRGSRGSDMEHVVNNYLSPPQSTTRATAIDRGVSPTIVNIGAPIATSRGHRRSRSRSSRQRRRRRRSRSRSGSRSRNRNKYPLSTTIINVGDVPSDGRNSRSSSKSKQHRRSQDTTSRPFNEKDFAYPIRGADYDRQSRRDDSDKALLNLAINGFYWKVHSLERYALLKYHAIDWLINILLIIQVSLSTVLVALNVTGYQSRTVIIILGVFIPVIAGFLAIMKGVGMPSCFYHHARELRKVILEIKRLEQTVTSGGSVTSEDCESLYMMYNGVQKEYDTGSSDLWGVNMFSPPQTAPEPQRVNIPSSLQRTSEQPVNLRFDTESEKESHRGREGKEDGARVDNEVHQDGGPIVRDVN